jgi:MFS family permease
MGPVMSATISDVVPPARRATWLSTYATVQGAGQALAPVIAGALIGMGRYDLAFIIAGAIGVLAPLLLATVDTHAVPAPSRAPVIERFTAGVAEVLRERRIVVASVTHASYYILNGTLNAFLPLFAQDRIGMSPAQIGWLFGMQTVTTLTIRPLIGAASDRLGRRGAIVAGLLACAGGVIAIAWSRGSAALYSAVLLYAAGVAITTAATSAYITDVAPRQRFGAAHGVFGTIYDIGDAGGPIIGGILIGLIGYTATFHTVAAIAVAAAAFFHWQSQDASRRG